MSALTSCKRYSSLWAFLFRSSVSLKACSSTFFGCCATSFTRSKTCFLVSGLASWISVEICWRLFLVSLWVFLNFSSHSSRRWSNFSIWFCILWKFFWWRFWQINRFCRRHKKCYYEFQKDEEHFVGVLIEEGVTHNPFDICNCQSCLEEARKARDEPLNPVKRDNNFTGQ